MGVTTISLMCAAQYMMEVDVSFEQHEHLHHARKHVNRQKLYKYYFGQFRKFQDFDKVMTACTQDCCWLSCSTGRCRARTRPIACTGTKPTSTSRRSSYAKACGALPAPRSQQGGGA